MLRVVAAVLSYVDELLHFEERWSEWNTRHSPVAFWLAFFSAVILVVSALLYGREVWRHIVGLWAG